MPAPAGTHTRKARLLIDCFKPVWFPSRRRKWCENGLRSQPTTLGVLRCSDYWRPLEVRAGESVSLSAQNLARVRHPVRPAAEMTYKRFPLDRAAQFRARKYLADPLSGSKPSSSCDRPTLPNSLAELARSYPRHLAIASRGRRSCLAFASEAALRCLLSPHPPLLAHNYGQHRPERKPARTRFFFSAALSTGSRR